MVSYQGVFFASISFEENVQKNILCYLLYALRFSVHIITEDSYQDISYNLLMIRYIYLFFSPDTLFITPHLNKLNKSNVQEQIA